MQYYIMVCNRNIWDSTQMEPGVEESYTRRNDRGNPRNVHSAFQKAKNGDRLLIYDCGIDGKRAITGIGRITRTDEEFIYFEILKQLDDKCLKKDDWGELKDKNLQGSLFGITEEQYEALFSKIKSLNPGVDLDQVFNKPYPGEKTGSVSETGNAKKHSHMRTIRVTGKGKINVTPDMTRITLTLEGIFPEYGETLRKSAEATEELKDLLSKFGFERSNLKTLNFSIDTKYESYKYRREWKSRFVGYEYSHRMKVEFDSDNTLLGKLLYALAHCPLKPEFRISFTVKDPEKSKNELMAKAVADAREKACVLTLAAGVKLLDVESIDYSWGEVRLEVEPMRDMYCESDCEAEDEALNIDIEPDDIELSDTVTVVWSIE